MFSAVLVKAFQIGEKVSHIICDMNMNADDFEKLGVEIIKVANDIRAAVQKAEEEKKASEGQSADAKPAEAQPEAQPEVKPEGS